MSLYLRATRHAALVVALNIAPSDTFVTSGSTKASIERIATLATARAAHTTTTLPTRELLVVGGMGPGGGALATAELIDVSTASVKSIGRMAHARMGHTSTALRDGRVVLAGGYNGEYLASVEVFDPKTRRFASLGELGVGRSGHTATLLGDGRILFVGGVGRGWEFLSSAELFDPASGRSESVAALSVPRESHTATLLSDGRVLIIGGHNGRRQNMVVHASAETYEPTMRAFQPAGNLLTPRHKHDAVRLVDGRVLVIAGADRTDRRFFSTTEVYDPATASFTMGPSLANARYKIQETSVRLANGDVLVTSGARTAELMQPRPFKFRSVPGNFPASYHFATATALPTGEVVIIGGYDEANQNTDGVWRFRR